MDATIPKSEPVSVQSLGRAPWVDRAILLFLPLFVWFLNPASLITPKQYYDPWVYYGYYLNLPEHVRTFPDYYFTSRLAATVPGWIAHSIFHDSLAYPLIHLGQFYVCICCLYGVVRKTVSRNAALIAAVALTMQGTFITAIGTDYVDSWGLTYLLLALWLVTRAASSPRWWLWHFAAGLSFAALPSTNILYVIWIPSAFALYLVLRRTEDHRPPLWQVVAAHAAGAFTLVVGLGLLNRSFGGRFLYLMPSVKWALGFYRSAEPNPYEIPWGDWVPHADWLMIPALLLLACVAQLGYWGYVYLQNRAAKPSPVSLYLLLNFVVMAGVFTAFECFSRSHLLAYRYQCSTLMAVGALALGVLVNEWHLDRPSPYLVVGLWLVAGAVVLYFTGRLFPSVLGNHSFPVLFGFSLLLVPLLLQRRVAVVRVIGLVTLFAFLNLCTIATQVEVRDSSPTILSRKDNLRLMTNTLRTLQDVERTGQVLFWYDEKDPLAGTFHDTTCTHLHLERTINLQFPQLPEPEAAIKGRLANYRSVVVMTSNESGAAQARQALESKGFQTSPRCVKRIRSNKHSFTLVVLELRPVTE